MMQLRIAIGKAQAMIHTEKYSAFRFQVFGYGVIASNNKNNIKNNYVNIDHKSIINISKPPILRDRCIYNGTSRINMQIHKNTGFHSFFIPAIPKSTRRIIVY